MAKNQRIKNKYEKLTNYHIVRKYSEVELVTDEGLTVMDSKLAYNKADAQNLDLVLMAVKGSLPVCKIMDYKKFLYDIKKKEKESKKNSNKTETKEIRLGLDIGKADIEHKCKKALQFLSKGASLKISLRIKGRRNMIRKGTGIDKIQMFFDLLSSEFEGDLKYTSQPKLQGRSWSATIDIDKK